MEKSRSKLRPMTETEKIFVMENHHLITRFLKLVKKDPSEYYDIVVFGFIQSAEIYLNDEELQRKYSFENVSYMYMKRELFLHFRSETTASRKSEDGNDLSYEELDFSISGNHPTMETTAKLEYQQTVEEITDGMTDEQKIIFNGKVEGYSLKEIAENNGITPKRVYKQFAKIKNIVADVMEINQVG